MHAQMERMKSEAVVDVFQFIKSILFQRTGLVANKVRVYLQVFSHSHLVTSWLTFVRINTSLLIRCWQISWMDLILMPTSRKSYKDFVCRGLIQ